MKKSKIILSAALLLTTLCIHTLVSAQYRREETQKLLSHTWYLKSVNGNPVQNENVHLSFDPSKDQAHLKVCNHFSGQYRINDDETSIEFMKMMGTLKMCVDDEIQQIERLITGLFSKNFAIYQVAEDDLSLIDVTGNTYTWYSDNKAKQLEYLEAHRWKLIQMNGNSKEYDQTMEFDFSENRIFGHSGCNNYFGGIAIEANQFIPGQMMSTKRGCLDKTRSEEENTFLNLLSGSGLTYDIADQVLNIYRDGEIVMMFARTEKQK